MGRPVGHISSKPLTSLLPLGSDSFPERVHHIQQPIQAGLWTQQRVASAGPKGCVHKVSQKLTLAFDILIL